MNISEESRIAILLALAEKISKDGWAPRPSSETKSAYAWFISSREEMVTSWLAAPDDDFIALAENLLGRATHTEEGRQKLREQGYNPDVLAAQVQTNPLPTLIDKITRRGNAKPK